MCERSSGIGNLENGTPGLLGFGRNIWCAWAAAAAALSNPLPGPLPPGPGAIIPFQVCSFPVTAASIIHDGVMSTSCADVKFFHALSVPKDKY